MKAMRCVCLAVILLFPLAGTALPWGNATTHPAIAATLVRNLPGLPILDVDLARFVRASACPDIADTQLFKSNGFGYVHSEEFANVLLGLAANDSKKLSTAYAWGVHIAADKVGHTEYVPEPSLLHSLVEVAVDTIIYYDVKTYRDGLLVPIGLNRWEDAVLRGDDCSPRLVYEASIRYQAGHIGARVIQPWQVWWATLSLGVAINGELEYIRAKGDAASSEAFLKSLGLGPFTPALENSVGAAEVWIEGNP